MLDEASSSRPPHPGLPPLAGLCTFEEAARPGLSVDACVARLKRYHYAFKRLHGIFISRLTAEPTYELKMAFSHHAYLCSEHVAALRIRVGEMREPPLKLDAVPDENLEVFFDEIQAAPTPELMAGIYEVAFPAFRDALRRHMTDTNPLADAPSARVCRFALIEVQEMMEYGARALPSMIDEARRTKMLDWRQLLDDCLTAAGALDGTQPPMEKSISRSYSETPFKFDSVPRRDGRFADPYNMGVNAEAFLHTEDFPADAKVLMLMYKRLREIDVPEMMASIIHETIGKPWAYTRDMTRQLWDEARHAMMGEVGFHALGLDWPKLTAINFNWSLALNTQLKPAERHAVLHFIEQGLMGKSGKRYEWEIAGCSRLPLAATLQDYDWADEVLHARIGRQWYVKEFESSKEAMKYGDECWNKVFVDFETYRSKGLTQHRNWWPDLYRAACSNWGMEPDPRVLAFHETYEKTRADLKAVTGSG